MTYWTEHARLLPSAEQQRIALGYWTDAFGGANIADLTPTRQDAFVADLLRRGHSRAYVSRTLSVGRAALQRAYKRGQLATVPFVADVERDDPPERHILNSEEARALINAAHAPHLHTFLMLAFCTLARPSAILDLTWPQVDRARGLIDLNPPGRRRTKKRRPVLPLSRVLAETLPTTPTSLYVVHYNGQRVASVKTAFRTARARAALPPTVTPYCIRHTMATVLREAGVPEWECAAFMGHRLPGYRTTERYARHRPDYLREAVRAIDAWMEKVLTLGATTPKVS